LTGPRSAALISQSDREDGAARLSARSIRRSWRAREAERTRWDGLLLAGSQNPTPDVFVSLTVAAAATEHIEVGTAVTNPVRRPHE
jgi:alkanesulfonate monooxygenase SsuD/methylene tetrahydromethanopterin reductase-like flavin-dependent oxidoreductase (luciferase family)